MARVKLTRDFKWIAGTPSTEGYYYVAIYNKDTSMSSIAYYDGTTWRDKWSFEIDHLQYTIEYYAEVASPPPFPTKETKESVLKKDPNLYHHIG